MHFLDIKNYNDFVSYKNILTKIGKKPIDYPMFLANLYSLSLSKEDIVLIIKNHYRYEAIEQATQQYTKLIAIANSFLTYKQESNFTFLSFNQSVSFLFLPKEKQETLRMTYTKVASIIVFEAFLPEYTDEEKEIITHTLENSSSLCDNFLSSFLEIAFLDCYQLQRVYHSLNSKQYVFIDLLFDKVDTEYFLPKILKIIKNNKNYKNSAQIVKETLDITI